jgi:5'-3' exonuclease
MSGKENTGTNMLTMIFDSNYMLHRCMKVPELAELKTSTGMYSGGVFGFLRSMRDVLNRFRPDVVYAVFDGGISKRRRTEYPPYKGAKYRDVTDPYYEAPDQELEEYLARFTKQRRQLTELMNCLGVRVIRLSHEADDVICALTRVIDGPVSVVSDDKDMLQLVHDTTYVFRPIAGQVITEENFERLIGMKQDVHKLCRAIMGDRSDRIEKVPGVGESTMTQLVRIIDDAKYPFDAFLEYCRTSNNSYVRKIYEHKEVVHRNYRLMCFEHEPMDAIYESIAGLIDTPVFIDRYVLNECFGILEFNKLLTDLDEWVVPFQRLVRDEAEEATSSY